jgi:hypothetical protein
MQKERNKGKSTSFSNPKQPGTSTAAFAIARKKQTKTSKEAGQKIRRAAEKGEMKQVKPKPGRKRKQLAFVASKPGLVNAKSTKKTPAVTKAPFVPPFIAKNNERSVRLLQRRAKR